MMRLLFAFLAGIALPATAHSAIVQIELAGVIRSSGPPSLGPGYPQLPVLTSPLKVGDAVTATLIFDDQYFHETGTTRLYDLYRYGSMTIQAGPFTWRQGNDFLDGMGIFACSPLAASDCDGIASPYAIYRNGVFSGFSTIADNGTSIVVPDIEVSGFRFKLGEEGYYIYNGPSFSGAFTSYNGIAVPEPSTWAMMIIGFAGIGLASRRSIRRSPARP